MNAAASATRNIIGPMLHGLRALLNPLAMVKRYVRLARKVPRLPSSDWKPRRNAHTPGWKLRWDLVINSRLRLARIFWLKCSETLRRLDLAVEVARRQEETQIPLKVAQDAVLFTAEWMRIAFMQFLSAEGKALMGIHDFGEWKAYAIERFRGILHLTVRNADKTRSAVPDWGKERIKEAWNVQ